MARSFGRVKTSVWDAGNDFRALSLEAQWLYLLLISQPNITSVGTLEVVPKRWARLAVGLELDRVEETLGELEAGWYVLVDRETEELLVRSFVKHDEPWKRPNNLAGARSAFRAVESDALRTYLAERHPWLEDEGGGGGEEAAEHESKNRSPNRSTDRSPNSGSNNGSDSGDDRSPHAVLLARGDETRLEETRTTGRSLGSSAAPLEAPPAEQEQGKRANGALPVAADCPVCGELHSVPLGFSMVDHLASVHGVEDPEALIASATHGGEA